MGIASVRNLELHVYLGSAAVTSILLISLKNLCF